MTGSSETYEIDGRTMGTIAPTAEALIRDGIAAFGEHLWIERKKLKEHVDCGWHYLGTATNGADLLWRPIPAMAMSEDLSAVVRP